MPSEVWFGFIGGLLRELLRKSGNRFSAVTWRLTGFGARRFYGVMTLARTDKLGSGSLRGLIGEGLREVVPAEHETLSIGVAHWDEALEGGLSAGAFCEWVVPSPSVGGQAALLGLLAMMRRERRFAALVDASDSFDPQTVPPVLLEHLLWVRCDSARQAIQAADGLARDENLGMTLVDLRGSEVRELKRIRSTVWYRLQRLAGKAEGLLVVFTPQPMIPSAQVRVELKGHLSLDLGDSSWDEVANRIKLDVLRLRNRNLDAFPHLIQAN